MTLKQFTNSLLVAASLLATVPAMAQPAQDPEARRLAKLLSLMLGAQVCDVTLAEPVQKKLEDAISTVGDKQTAITPENMPQVMDAMSGPMLKDTEGFCKQFKALDISDTIDATLKE